MEDFLQKPEATDAPSASSTAPWTKRINYKSGKTPEGFAATAEPEQVKAGFTYYDKDQGAKFQVTGFTASIVAILSGVSGTVPNGTRYDNYWSSLVQDTRSQKLSVYLGSGDNKVVIASGIYNDFKAGLPDGVGYTKTAVCYIHETKECVLIELSAAVENVIKEAIANETGQNPARINLFNLFELSTKFWAIRFKGAFSKRTREGVAWSGKGDMFFYPQLQAGVVSTEQFPILLQISTEVDKYVESGQRYLSQGQQAQTTNHEQPSQSASNFAPPVKAPALSSANNFPTEAPPAWTEVAGDGDDLPF